MTTEMGVDERRALRWVVVLLAVLAVVALLAYERGEPGVGDRVPDREESSATLVEG